jgi:hypothetical protein
VDPQEPPRRHFEKLSEKPSKELIMKKIALVAALFLVACGDKVPQSEAAKQVGNIPKQTIDNAAAGVNKAMQQGSERLEEKKE